MSRVRWRLRALELALVAAAIAAVSRPADSQARADTTRPGYTAADVRFMQGMIEHHAQALDMTGLVPSRSSRQDMRLLAERIEVSQRDEIAMMRAWLMKRGERAPNVGATQGHGEAAVHHAPMPGMLSAEELDGLQRAKGPEFERLFLQLMIRHHEGALVMVKELFGSRGAGQDTEIFTFASDVDADQRAEIQRMGAMLDALGNARRP
jgi:uncharacterized protein (DUF305 family)